MWLRYAAVVPLAVAGLCLGAALRHALTRRQVSRWPVADGKVLKSSVDTRRFTVASQETYGLRVVYTYRAGKRVLQADALSPEGPLFTSSRQRAEREAARFPPGARVTVRYDPADPRRAYLLAGGSMAGIWMNLFGAAAFTGGAALIWWSL